MKLDELELTPPTHLPSVYQSQQRAEKLPIHSCLWRKTRQRQEFRDIKGFHFKAFHRTPRGQPESVFVFIAVESSKSCLSFTFESCLKDLESRSWKNGKGQIQFANFSNIGNKEVKLSSMILLNETDVKPQLLSVSV